MYLVKIEFQRVQTFLFAVPRLRDMVGANVLLGEAIRVKMPELAIDCGSRRLDASKHAPEADADDLLCCDRAVNDDIDNPQLLYEKGILARDGGHFRAVFDDEKTANNFKAKAETYLAEYLPGLRFSIQLSRIEGDEETPLTQRETEEENLFDLPQFQVCEESGNSPASKGPPDKKRWVSESVNRTKERGKDFFKKRNTRDVVGLMFGGLPLSNDKKNPADFEQLCGPKYLAVIQADGNAVGKRSNAWRNLLKKSTPDYLEREACGEHFYHSMRVAVRKSLKKALEETFADYDDDNNRPYHLLMLGGDDLLLVCRARYALKFVVEYAKQLKNYRLTERLGNNGEPAAGAPLTIGAGVVIASPKLPFHRLHQIAEELAGSAKRLYRSREDPAKCSVVDWMVVTQSWAEDPIEARVRDHLVQYDTEQGQETLVLSRRPYPVLRQNGAAESDLNSLEALLDAAKNLETMENSHEKNAARSQLKKLIYEIPKGRMHAKLIFEELAEETQKALKKALKNAHVIEPFSNLKSSNLKNTTYTTPIVDLVEISEIPRLHRNVKEEESS